jgi:hypothetical protein
MSIGFQIEAVSDDTGEAGEPDRGTLVAVRAWPSPAGGGSWPAGGGAGTLASVPPRGQSRSMIWRILISIVLAAALSPVATADTIHLVNGRVIFTAEARVVGDRVEFVQYGGEQAIPIEQVAAIEQDDRRGPSTARGGGATAPASAVSIIPAAGSVKARPAESPSPPLQRVGAGGIADLLPALNQGDSGPLADLLPMLAQADAGQLAGLMPIMGQLGKLLSAENPTPEGAAANLASLLASLRGMGVTPEMISERAAALGVSLEGIQLPRF